MPLDPALRTAIRKDPASRVVIAAWRRLTGGAKVRDKDRRTLIACSGGADSSSLAIILAAATENIVIGHVLHDLRTPREAGADRDASKKLAARLGAPFLYRRAAVRALPGNAEANARRVRYELLGRMAKLRRCTYAATAHHADDQAETVLMRLLSGAGPGGLTGVHPRRALAEGVGIVRPMLGITRADAERICRTAGWTWASDKTNTDTRRLRAALRARVMPVLREISPRGALAIARAAELQADAAGLVRRRAVALARGATQAKRDCVLGMDQLAGAPGIVVGATLRLLYRRVVGPTQARGLTSKALRPVVEAVTAREPNRLSFHIGAAEIVVTPKRVVLRRRVLASPGGAKVRCRGREPTGPRGACPKAPEGRK